ncbi:phage terminase large subunit family protein [Pelosinus baikalensis]|uniref:Phage terminase large subunit family protein n=1 Tax=Pelosinus baikalensis TaxID=2892015 RepID=A0ABS8I032_9FIRM|nr:terminase gpA endonuclease subunit [Pelosinus baikalensis]MCC5467634.1 phage terminase large subunit family protein [Pelosinus baikalensis]
MRKREAILKSSNVKQTLDEAIKRALQIFKPPEKISVSEWADKYRLLSSEETSKPGAWKTASVPYMKFIMDCFADERIKEICWLKCTQIGGTEGLLNMVGYVIDQDPGRIMYVLPDEELCKDFSELRLQKMLKSCPTLAEKFYMNDSKDTLLKFKSGFIVFGSARVPGKLATWSTRYVMLDEIDKFPLWSGREANPLKLVEERTKNWWNSKIVKVSTPTLKTGAIYQAYEKSDIKYDYYVPCPYCGHEQTFTFKNITWPKNEDGTSDITIVRNAAYYECEKCKGRIDDRHKAAMLRAGKWKPKNKVAGKARSIGFHINSIYSPWLTFGSVAAEFLSSKDDPAALMNFVNSWLGEPWEDKAATLDSSKVLEKQSDLQESVIPDYTQIITAGVDVQKNRMYWSIRAWGAHYTSQNIAHGMVETWEELEFIMNKRWPDTNGELKWQVHLCAVDSGYDTENVYDFCLMNQDWAVPVKGSSTQMVARFKKSIIDNVSSKSYGQTLYIVDGDQYKNVIAARLNRPVGIGCFMVFKDCDLDYAEQLTSEHKIRTKKNNREVETWVPKTSHAQNHYLDTEVYAALAADLLQVRYLDEIQPEVESNSVVRDKEEDDWINIKEEDW